MASNANGTVTDLYSNQTNTTTTNYKNTKLNEALKIATFNVRGLKNRKKRRALIRVIKREKTDIIGLQETHINSENEIRDTECLWGGKVHSSLGSNRSKGLITLFHPKYNQHLIKEVFNNDRIIISLIEIDNEKLYIINVYSPCTGDNEKKDFINLLISTIKTHIPPELEGNIICIGDFNIAMNSNDIISGQQHSTAVCNQLRDGIQQVGLTDSWRLLHRDEKCHTWSRAAPPTARRLDYIFTGDDLTSSIRESHIKSIGFSDHRYVSTTIEFSSFKFGKSYYKIDSSLLTDAKYCNIITSEINETLHTYRDINPSLKFEMIKKNVTEVSQQYSKFKKRDRKDNIKIAQEKLNKLENDLISEPENREVIREISKTKATLELMEIETTKSAAIRAGIKYIEEGEKNSRYFYALEKSRLNLSTIKQLKSKTTQKIIKNEKEILEEIKTHYEQIYNKSIPPPEITADRMDTFTRDLNLPTLSQAQVADCDNPLSEQDITSAIRAMQRGKAPGLDGIPLEWYVVFWRLVKKPLLESYQHSYNNNCLPESQRTGIISLLHKGKSLDTTNLNNWRPISLLNYDFKILSKALALRLERVLPSIIGQQQFGFVKNRQIANAHRNIDDIMNIHREKKLTGLLLAVDFRQAFDSLNMQTVYKSLELFGFGQEFTKWVKLLNTERVSRIKNGGHISETFNINLSVRQGCPLSAQLFTITVEILAQKLLQNPNLQGVKPVTALDAFKVIAFADDTTILCKNLEDLNITISTLDMFASFSNLHLNYDKSFAISLNGEQFDTGSHNIKFKDTLKILGIYFSNKKPAGEIEENWNDRISRINRIFEQWSRRDLTIIGKVNIIKTFGLSQIVFIMNSISIPTKILQRLNTIFYTFLWKRKHCNKRAMEKVSRNVTTNKYENGGLNMIDTFSFQDAYLLQWAEKLLKPKVEKWKEMAKHILKDVGGIKVFKSKTDLKGFKGLNSISSPFWKAVVTTWLKHSKSNANDTHTYSDPLFNNKHITFQGQTLFLPTCIERGVTSINDVINDHRNIIDFQEYRNRYGEYPRSRIDYGILSTAVNRVLRNNTMQHSESYLFQGNTAGNIGRKNFLKMILGQTIPKSADTWQEKYGTNVGKKHWRAVHGTKETRLRSLNWKLIHNIYPTNILLHKMGVTTSERCTHCDTNIDYIEHMFFHCNSIQRLWKEIETIINTQINVQVNITEEMAILGITEIIGVSHRKVTKINHLLSIGRMVISKYRHGPKRNLIEILETDLKMRKFCDYTI